MPHHLFPNRLIQNGLLLLSLFLILGISVKQTMSIIFSFLKSFNCKCISLSNISLFIFSIHFSARFQKEWFQGICSVFLSCLWFSNNVFITFLILVISEFSHCFYSSVYLEVYCFYWLCLKAVFNFIDIFYILFNNFCVYFHSYTYSEINLFF